MLCTPSVNNQCGYLHPGIYSITAKTSIKVFIANNAICIQCEQPMWLFTPRCIQYHGKTSIWVFVTNNAISTRGGTANVAIYTRVYIASWQRQASRCLQVANNAICTQCEQPIWLFTPMYIQHHGRDKHPGVCSQQCYLHPRWNSQCGYLHPGLVLF